MSPAMIEALRDLDLSPLEEKRGEKVVTVALQDGTTRTFTVSAVPQALLPSVLGQYVNSGDARDVARAVVPREFSSDAFLDSLLPGDLARVCNVALALCLGKKNFLGMLRGSLNTTSQTQDRPHGT